MRDLVKDWMIDLVVYIDPDKMVGSPLENEASIPEQPYRQYNQRQP